MNKKIEKKESNCFFCSVGPARFRFVKENNLSPSKILKLAIDKMILEDITIEKKYIEKKISEEFTEFAREKFCEIYLDKKKGKKNDQC